jgi:hypothetical protein
MVHSLGSSSKSLFLSIMPCPTNRGLHQLHRVQTSFLSFEILKRHRKVDLPHLYQGAVWGDIRCQIIKKQADT